MSKERELLKECRLMLDNPINGTAGRNLQIRITELLAQPEQEPLSKQQYMWFFNDTYDSEHPIADFVRAIEKAHGIGVDDE